MIKNYFFLNRLVIELGSILPGSRILSAFSQEKDKLILECRKGEDEYYLELSVNQHFPYLSLKDRFSRGKKNVADLFTEFFPSEVMRISIAKYDRTIRLLLNSSELFFYIRGNKTNVIAVAGDQLSSFKKADDTEMTSFIDSFRKQEFISGYAGFNLNEENNILKKYPFLGKEIAAEANLRKPEDISSAVVSIINDIKNNKPVVYSGEDEIRLAVENFRLFRSYKAEIFDNLLSAVNYYISRKYSSEFFLKRKKSLLAGIESELERAASRINNLRGRLEAGSKEELYNKYANLLLINLGSFDKGSNEIEVGDIYENNEIIKIKIDPSLSPQKNVDKYFEKARSERINYIKSKELYEISVSRYNQLKEKHLNIKNITTPEELKKMDPLKKESGRPGDKEDLKDKFRQYIIEGKYRLYVGTDSERNDLLTTRFAKQNDYWFHARGVSGSHVVLRVENTKEPIPKPVLKKAASIAAYHSKAKTASLVPVAYTLKKYVIKKKGMETGKVALMKEQVLLVKPEIPQGCEYISRE
jgi:predicted ribosome quality control (RQC) complex YloA/Tae2 family protein